MSSTLFVDSRLRGIKITKLLGARGALKRPGNVVQESGHSADQPVLAAGQDLVPDELYPSAANPKLRYYLPRYRVALDDDGRPEVRFRFTPDEEGQVGSLTLDLTWDPPVAEGLSLRGIDHSADLMLVYRIPIEDSAPASHNGADETLLLQPLSPVGDRRSRSITSFGEKELFDSVYQAISDLEREAALEIRVTAQVGVRSWKQVVLGRPTKLQQVFTLKNKAALFTQMLSPKAMAPLNPALIRRPGARIDVRAVDADEERKVREARRGAAASPDLARVLARRTALPSARLARSARVVQPAAAVRVAAAPAPLMARVLTPAARIVRPVASTSPAASLRASVGRSALVRGRRAAGGSAAAGSTSQPRLRRSAAAPRDGGSAQPAAVVQPAIRLRSARLRRAALPATGRLRADLVTARRSAEVRRAEGRAAISSATLRRMNAPGLAAAIAKTDLRVGKRKAVPTELAMDGSGEPAVVDVEEENLQKLPFTFDPATQREVYVTPEFQPGRPRLLKRLTLVRPDGSQVLAFEDNLTGDVHVPPHEFRLVRDEAAPYSPSISFTPVDSITTTEGDAGEAELLFRVIVNYRLEPWIDPDVIELAQKSLGEDLRFTPIVPRDASLRLDFLDEEQDRADAQIDFEHGITDHFVLDHEQFTQFWTQRLLAPGVAATGKVTYRAFDGSEGVAQVRLSLREESDELLDVRFAGSVEGAAGEYGVWIRNRVESPVRIAHLPGEYVSEGVVAEPVEDESLFTRVLAPQERVQVRYRVPDDAEPLTDLEPVVIGSAEPDPRSLLPRLLIKAGYSSMGFSVPVRATAGVFDPPPEGNEPLTGLLVEFDDGGRIELSPEASEGEIGLVGRLVDQIMGTADDQQRYFFRVTNLHGSGEGARTGWSEGEGTEELVVGRATVQTGGLDF